jgi:hypothetical protein
MRDGLIHGAAKLVTSEVPPSASGHVEFAFNGDSALPGRDAREPGLAACCLQSESQEMHHSGCGHLTPATFTHLQAPSA